MWYKYLLIFILSVFLLGCGGGSSGTSNIESVEIESIDRESEEKIKDASVYINYELSSLYSYEKVYELPPEPPSYTENKRVDIFRSVIEIKNIETGSVKKLNGSLDVDQENHTVLSDTVLELPIGSYEISVLTTHLATEYYGKTTVSITSQNSESTTLVLDPIFAEGITTISQVRSLVQYDLDFATTDLFYKADHISLKTESGEDFFYTLNKNSMLKSIYVQQNQNSFSEFSLHSGDNKFFKEELKDTNRVVYIW